jgi:hypothetical protein
MSASAQEMANMQGMASNFRTRYPLKRRNENDKDTDNFFVTVWRTG